MIKLNGHRTLRECEADFQYTDDKGETKFETIRVLYFSPRHDDLKKLRAKFEKQQEENPNAIMFALSEGLATQLHSLPDLADAKGKPLKIEAAVLEAHIDVLNLQAIRDAIDGDLEAGKSKPAK